MPADQFQGFAHIADFRLQRNVRIRHGSCADHAFFSLMDKGVFQQFNGIFLDLDVLKGMLHVIAFAPGIAVNTAVGTASVEIHSVLGR